MKSVILIVVAIEDYTMASVTVLSDDEQQRIRSALEEFSDLTDHEGSLMPYLFEQHMSDDEVEVRFFATPEEGPAQGIRFEIYVEDTAPWYEGNLGSYSADNLRNGGPHYQALEQELSSLVQEVVGEKPEFICSKGGAAFTTEVSL